MEKKFKFSTKISLFEWLRIVKNYTIAGTKQKVKHARMHHFLIDCFYAVEKNNIPVERLEVSAKMYKCIRDSGVEIDPYIDLIALTSGLVADLWNAQIYVVSTLKDNEVRVCSSFEIEEPYDEVVQIPHTIELE